MTCLNKMFRKTTCPASLTESVAHKNLGNAQVFAFFKLPAVADYFLDGNTNIHDISWSKEKENEILVCPASSHVQCHYYKN